jgi:hypothetical protein
MQQRICFDVSMGVAGGQAHGQSMQFFYPDQLLSSMRVCFSGSTEFLTGSVRHCRAGHINGIPH